MVVLFNFFYFGEMAEWLNAAVSKTVEAKASGGSNPPLSAMQILSPPPANPMYAGGYFSTSPNNAFSHKLNILNREMSLPKMEVYKDYERSVD